MIALDDLIAPARATRRALEVTGLAKSVVLEFTPVSVNNPVFLDDVLRREVEGGAAEVVGREGMKADAAKLATWCALGMVVDGERRDSEAVTFLHRLIDLAPAKYLEVAKALQAPVDVVDAEALAGNS